MVFASPGCQHSFVGNTRGRHVPPLFKACRGRRRGLQDAGGDPRTEPLGKLLFERSSRHSRKKKREKREMGSFERS